MTCVIDAEGRIKRTIVTTVAEDSAAVGHAQDGACGNGPGNQRPYRERAWVDKVG